MARKEQQGGGKSWIFWGAACLSWSSWWSWDCSRSPRDPMRPKSPTRGLDAEGPDPSAQPVEPEEEPTEGEAPARCEDMDADESVPHGGT